MSSTEETQAVAEGFSRRGTPHGRLLVRVALLYLFLLFPVGLVEFFVVLALALSVALATYPLWFWALPGGAGLQWPGFVADTAPEALLVMLVGCVAATAAAGSVLGAAWAHAALGRVLLGPREA